MLPQAMSYSNIQHNQPHSKSDNVAMVSINPIWGCNLSCVHCFIPEEERAKRNVIDAKKLESRLNDINVFYRKINAISRKDKTRLIIDIFGGEIHLLETDLLDELCSIIHNFKRYNENLFYSIEIVAVSNIIGINKNKLIKICEILKKYDITFSTSFDLNVNRFPSRATFFKWIENARYISDNGFNIGCIVVLMKSNISVDPEILIYFLRKFAGFDEIAFDTFILAGDSEKYASLIEPKQSDVISYINKITPYNNCQENNVLIANSLNIESAILIDPYASIKFRSKNGNEKIHYNDNSTKNINIVDELSKSWINAQKSKKLSEKDLCNNCFIFGKCMKLNKKNECNHSVATADYTKSMKNIEEINVDEKMKNFDKNDWATYFDL